MRTFICITSNNALVPQWYFVYTVAAYGQFFNAWYLKKRCCTLLILNITEIFRWQSGFIKENNFDYLESKILSAWVGESNWKFEKW